VIHLSSILKYRPTPSQYQMAFVSLIILSCVLYIVVYTHIPLFIWITGSYDDGLFIELGRSLAMGQWLGPYSHFTLMKGPGYPIFLAISSWLGVSVSFMHALFHCTAVTFLTWVITRISKSRLLGISIFLVTLWHPSMFIIGRLLRANIYAPQTIFILAVFSYALFVADPRAQRIKWGLLAGLILGWYWLTREEGVWILPGIGILILFEGIREWRKGSFIRVLEPSVSMAMVCIILQFAFSFTNWIIYDKYIGVDFKEKNFKAAITALQSVRAGKPIPYLPLPHAARDLVYKFSPTFATLKDFLDPPGGSPWQVGCSWYSWTCGDMSGVLMWWAIRNGADSKGYYETPEKASQFYGAIAKEVNAACDDGRLDCEERWFSFLPVLTKGQLDKIPATTLAMINRLSDTQGFHPPYRASLSTKEKFLKTLVFLNHPTHFPLGGTRKDRVELDIAPKEKVLIEGWYYDKKKGDAWFYTDFSCPDKSNLGFSLDRVVSPDIVDHFRDPKASLQRFGILAEYNKDCNLIIKTRDAGKLSLKMGEIIKTYPKSWAIGSKILFFDTATLNPYRNEFRIRTSYRIRSAIYKGYKAVFPILIGVGFLSFLGGIPLMWKKRTWPVLFALAGACWTLIAVRIVILVLIDISSFPAIQNHYLLPAYILLCIAPILSIGAVLSVTWNKNSPCP
jgi:hypothetical protein